MSLIHHALPASSHPAHLRLEGTLLGALMRAKRPQEAERLVQAART